MDQELNVFNVIHEDILDHQAIIVKEVHVMVHLVRDAQMDMHAHVMGQVNRFTAKQELFLTVKGVCVLNVIQEDILAHQAIIVMEVHVMVHLV